MHLWAAKLASAKRAIAGSTRRVLCAECEPHRGSGGEAPRATGRGAVDGAPEARRAAPCAPPMLRIPKAAALGGGLGAAPPCALQAVLLTWWQFSPHSPCTSTGSDTIPAVAPYAVQRRRRWCQIQGPKTPQMRSVLGDASRRLRPPRRTPQGAYCAPEEAGAVYLGMQLRGDDHVCRR